MFGNTRHIIAIVVLVIFGAGAYYVATSDNFFTGHQARAEKIEERTIELEREIITPLKRLSLVEINLNIFSSPEFNALTDKSVSLRAPALNRTNPFAPAN